MAAFDRQTFDCSAFPGSDLCSSNFDDWIETAYKHIEIAVDVCDGACVALEFQGGVLKLVGGAGTAGVGGSVTWNSLAVEEQGSLYLTVCAAYYAGICGGIEPHVDSNGNWVGLGWEAGIAFGMGETEPFIGYKIISYDFRSGKLKGPQNPLPPTVDRWFTTQCEEVWWCG